MRIGIAALSISLSGCATIPDYQRPEVHSLSEWPAASVAGSENGTIVEDDWWANFGSAELDAFVNEAMASSPTMDAALARITQARASLRGTRSLLLPSADASANASRRYTTIDGEGTRSSNSDGAALSVGYELDLFGGKRARIKGANQFYAAEVFNTEATALILQSDIASLYFAIVSLKENLYAARANLTASERILELVKLRHRNGAISGFELARQQSSVAAIRARIPALEQQLLSNNRALAVLIGRTPGSDFVQTKTLASLALPSPALMQPSQLLERRPDLKAAEANLKAANANIGVAKAAFFPRISLSAGVAGAGAVADPASLISSLAAGLTQPIFAGGALRADLRGTKARFVELAANYRDTVLSAFGETLDALTAIEISAQRARHLGYASNRADEAFALAQRKFDAGAIDLLELLDAQRTQLDAADALVQGKLDRLQASVDLFRALGGSWRGTPV